MSLEDFRARYIRHVGYVVAGDMKASLADMVQENIPQVFEGIKTPREAVPAHRIVDVRAEGDRMVGETIYETRRGPIGLRSIWELHDDVWLAAALENFPTDAESGTGA